VVDLEYSASSRGREQEIIDLMAATFTASEGIEEGALIGDFVRHLLHSTPERDLFVFIAQDGGEIVGSVIFSRLTYDHDDRIVFILSPLAVATKFQGKGIGRKLVAHGLKTLEAAHVDVAVTYGDPGFYSKVGFSQISEAFAAAPFRLTRPEGWMGKSLTDRELTPLKGSPRCVEALSDPKLW
jgi:predicted N-acetyltransferase YhbS